MKSRAPNNVCSGQGFALRVRKALLAIVLVRKGVLLVCPAANTCRWAADYRDERR